MYIEASRQKDRVLLLLPECSRDAGVGAGVGAEVKVEVGVFPCCRDAATFLPGLNLFPTSDSGSGSHLLHLHGPVTKTIPLGETPVYAILHILKEALASFS